MRLFKWEELPDSMRTEAVRPYYEALRKKRGSLFCKRLFDIFCSGLMLLLLSPVFLILALMIKWESKGPVFYRQTRVTRYGRIFRIHKFRTMCENADQMGTLVTLQDDPRVTRIGKHIRDKRLDELAQLLDVFTGQMTFVGTRPEVPKYVDHYTPEMMATLLLPAGVTNLASIYFKGEAALLDGAQNPDRVYIEKILPRKMEWNLKGVREYRFWKDIRIMFMTFFAVLGKK